MKAFLFTMKQTIPLFILLFIFAWNAPVFARGLDTESVLLMVPSTVALVADWGTTLDIERHADIYETNPYLGKHPSRGAVNRYFSAMLAAHVIGNYLIQQIHNEDLRRIAKYMENLSVTMVHGSAAYNNRVEFWLEYNF